MQINRGLAATVVAAMVLSGCATSPKNFYAAPNKINDTTLCRTAMDEYNKNGRTQYFDDMWLQIEARGLTAEKCNEKVTAENVGVGLLVGAIAVGTVAVACRNGCAAPSGGGYAPSRMDTDCQGGGGDGPLYVRGPIWVGGYDPDDLDRDGDGWGCELNGQDWGA